MEDLVVGDFLICFFAEGKQNALSPVIRYYALAWNATARFCGQKRGFARRKLDSSQAKLASWLRSGYPKVLKPDSTDFSITFDTASFSF